MIRLLQAALLFRVRTKPATPSVHRAWVEINLNHLEHNLLALKQALPSRCLIMAVVKANAYGHGSAPVAQFLNRIGVNHFAVAEIEEGIELRKHGVKGEILILSYTSPGRVHDLSRYRLTQTIVSAEHGQALNQCGRKLKVHVKIDTGMNRLGEPYVNIQAIRSCYEYEHLHVTGTFSHLSVSDRVEPEQTAFTNMQVDRFMNVIQQIKAAGHNPGDIHIQSSYGILNYPMIDCDLARPGIALYGLLSKEDDLNLMQVKLRPALSLKATVAQVKDVRAHCPIGYGHKFIPSHDIRIAALTIGYADGVPKTLADRGGYVLIRGQRARIVGNICMDQLMVDVTSIEGVEHGDTATLIGQDGAEVITACQFAKRCGTVTNEIVSRIGSRVARVYTS
ncbi:serine racemase VanT catalytic subunit [Paenibacillus mendelii]|uniref:Alanine racemase n=1 Tax=Paenibacillus mendelii TaxID=206163 RepID=A0ABV6JM59_9BACL|nr:serine racemase VanT catalytic subunit [Paenibacillus mendelii]MCQ6562351.1 serine racemase VanT catalytic subunit [Paenibacillus mendelii]